MSSKGNLGWVVVVISLICLCGLASAQEQAKCTFSYFAITKYVTPYGINDNGVVVGQSNYKGYTRLHDGVVTLYSVPGSISTFFNGINDSSVKVGGYVPSGTSTTVGLMKSGKNYASLHHPGDTWGTTLTGINKTGELVGWYLDSQEFSHGFTWTNGTFTALDYPNATNTAAYGINDSGTTVGYYAFNDGTNHGFVHQNGSFSSFDFPGSLATSFNGISNAGVILGTTRLPQNELWTPFIYTNGTYKIVSAPNAQSTSANGISPKGVLTGIAFFSNGRKGFTAVCK